MIFIQSHKKLIYRIHGYKSTKISISKTSDPRIYTVKRGYSHPWYVRIATCYKVHHGVRWYHTSRPSYGGKKRLLYPFTAKVIKNPYSILALLNKPGENFVKIQILSRDIKEWPKPEELYKKSSNILLGQPKTLVDVLEINFVQRFQSISEKGIIIGTYNIMNNKYGCFNLETMQIKPDLVNTLINNKTFQFKGYLGVDEKHKITSVINYGEHQVINSIDYN